METGILFWFEGETLEAKILVWWCQKYFMIVQDMFKIVFYDREGRNISDQKDEIGISRLVQMVI